VRTARGLVVLVGTEHSENGLDAMTMLVSCTNSFTSVRCRTGHGLRATSGIGRGVYGRTMPDVNGPDR
jgi:hypothetical protein